jgi:glycosyltransferase involved in cell wall biosynthesis
MGAVRIAILGTRGVPANYGGFETFAEECASRLVSRGHRVTVYGRSHYIPKALRSHRGIDLVVLPSLQFKYLDTVSHTFLSVLHALPQRFDAILICNAANSIYAWLPRLLGTPVALNVDGIERMRLKWGALGRAYYHVCEYLSTILPNVIVTDARVIERYYRDRYAVSSVYIPYGAITELPDGKATLEALGLQSREYFLYVSRLEPENNAHLVVRAFEKVNTTRRLVVVGDAPYARDYIRSVKSTRDSRILFPGAIYGHGYRELMGNAFCYIHATEVGGAHPALLEAMGQGNLIIVNGTPENTEVLGNCGLVYRKNDAVDLARKLQDVVERPERYECLRRAALDRAIAEYSWDSIVARYEELFARLTTRS